MSREFTDLIDRTWVMKNLFFDVDREVVRKAPAVDAEPVITGETSDGYHTFNELYHHRAVLFSVIVKAFEDKAWKSRKHHDGTMYDGMFIVGIQTPDGQATYHYDMEPYWDMFCCKEIEHAPEWDGHTPAQAIERIGKLEPVRHGRWEYGINSNMNGGNAASALCRKTYSVALHTARTAGRRWTEVRTMIDKTLRKATAERHGPMVVIRMTGGGDCLWLNMYLDCEHGQMTCDSDIGFYAYHWGRGWTGEGFVSFCIRWFSDEEWLLRKCIGEQHVEKKFDRDASIEALRRDFAEEHENDEDECDVEAFDLMCEFDRVLEIAGGYDDRERFATALCVAADERDIDLPEEWWSCLVEDYTPWQKRFSEICREVIVPAIKALDKEKRICSVNSGPCCECKPGAPCSMKAVEE